MSPRVLGHLFKADAKAVESELAKAICSVPGVASSKVMENQRWHEIVYRSRSPLTQREIDQAKVSGFPRPEHYEYTIWMAVSHHVLLLATNIAIIDAFAGRHLRRHGTHLSRTQIRVADLVRNLVTTPDQYALTHIHARMGGFGESLKALSLWGDDLGDSQFVRDSNHLLFGLQCGLRRLGEDRELIRITNEGKVSFFFDTARLRTVESLLAYLYGKSYYVD